MALDFDAIKRKLERLSGNNTSRNVMWKPEEGQEYEVRLLSFPDNDGQPFKELMFYYNIPGQRGLLAPSQFGKRDPIQELIDKLRNEGTKESYEMAKKLYPKMRVYAPVVVRGEEKEGVRFWGFGKTVYQELLSVIADPDYGDITDSVSGRDVAVEFKTAEETGKSFPSTSIRVKPNQTPITEDASALETITESQKNITDIYQERSYDELTQALNDYLNGDSSSEETTKKEEVVKAAPASSFDKKETSDAFDDLFNS